MASDRLDHWPSITAEDIQHAREFVQDDGEVLQISVKITIGEIKHQVGCWRYAMAYLAHVRPADRVYIEIKYADAYGGQFLSVRYRIYAHVDVITNDDDEAILIEFREIRANDGCDSCHGGADFDLRDWEMRDLTGDDDMDDFPNWSCNNAAQGPSLDEVPVIRSYTKSATKI